MLLYVENDLKWDGLDTAGQAGIDGQTIDVGLSISCTVVDPWSSVYGAILDSCLGVYICS